MRPAPAWEWLDPLSSSRRSLRRVLSRREGTSRRRASWLHGLLGGSPGSSPRELKRFPWWRRLLPLTPLLLLGLPLWQLVALPATPGKPEVREQPAVSLLSALRGGGNWTVREFPDVPAAFVLRDRSSNACFLLLENSCHVSGHAETGRKRWGHWVVQDGSGGDLSQLPPKEDVCDFTHLGPRVKNSHKDRDVSTIGMIQAYVGVFTNKGLGEEDIHAVWQPRGLVAGRDGHLGHLVEAVGGTMEVLLGVDRTLAEQGHRPLHGSPLPFYFPFDPEPSRWALGISHLLLGPQAPVIAGRGSRQAFCFKEVILPLTLLHSEPTSVELHRRISEFVAGGDPVGGRGGGEGGERAVMWQATVLERTHARVVSNFGEVVSTVAETFPDLAVETYSFANDTFWTQVAVMRRSAVVVAMHGAQMSNVVFMSPGALVLELFPFKFAYNSYRIAAERMGVRYTRWSNTWKEASGYDNDCMEDGGWEDWEEHKCHTLTECRFCVRDHSITIVNITELKAVLKKEVPLVTEFLARNLEM